MAKFYNWENEFDQLKIGNKQENCLKNWIEDGIDENAIKWAESFGKYLAKSENAIDQNWNVITKNNKNQELKELSSSQLRKFFGALKALQNEILMDSQISDDDNLDKNNIRYKHELLMLKPKLAYAAARAKSDYAKIHNFYEVISECIDLVKTKKHFKNFIALVEAIVAYHKVEEESKNKI